MIYFSESEIDSIILEDIPYFDLTTHSLEIGQLEGELTFSSREEGVVTSIEILKKIFSKLDIKLEHSKSDSDFIFPGDIIAKGYGKAVDLHMAWKVSLNLLEYSMGISTEAYKLVSAAKKANPSISVVSTRKSFPGTKKIANYAAISGGMLPHRLGLSETVLVFDNHKRFFDEKHLESFISNLQGKCHEKKIIVEVESFEESLKYAKLGVDGIQFDKMPLIELKKSVKEIRSLNSGITLIAAGGINKKNAEEYAATGIDVISTSSVFHAKPLDIKARIEKI